MNLEWRLLNIERRNPHLIAAMDQAIFESCEAGNSPPTLVLHNWERAVSLANGQALSDLDLQACAREGFSVVRLTTGGKAVIHFPDTEFTYSLFTPISEIDPKKTYELYCGRIANALLSLGVQSAVVDNNDIFVDKRKIGGNAQHVKRRFAMQQGIILYEKPSAQKMLSLMSPSLYGPNALGELDELLTGVRSFSSASQEQLQQILVAHLLDGEQYSVGTLSPQEQERVAELQMQYRSTQEAQAPQTRGLCWLPAPAYRRAKMEATA